MYDPKCETLAALFLGDWPSVNTPQNVKRLAQVIQDAAESEIESMASDAEAKARDPHEQAAERARGDDFEETNGKDWT